MREGRCVIMRNRFFFSFRKGKKFINHCVGQSAFVFGMGDGMLKDSDNSDKVAKILEVLLNVPLWSSNNFIQSNWLIFFCVTEPL